MINDRRDFVLLGEVAAVLAEHEVTRGAVQVEFTDHALRLTITVAQDAGLDVTELGHALAYLAGLGQVRAFATHYGMDAEALERLLPGANR